jgi:hypothetical protein
MPRLRDPSSLVTVAWTRRIRAAVIAIAVLGAAGCAGILGLDQTSPEKGDGGPGSGSGSGLDGAVDATSTMSAEGSPGDETPAGNDGTAPGTDGSSPPDDARVDSAMDAGLGPAPEAGPTGTVDTAFQGGFVLDTESPDASTVWNAIGIDPSGRVVAGGQTGAAGWLLHRYLSDGSPDTSFDSAVASLGGNLPSVGSLNGLAIDPDSGDVICTGTNGSQLVILVLDASGHLAGTFHGGSPLIAGNVGYPMGSAGFAVSLTSAKNSFAVAGNGGQPASAHGLLSQVIGESDTPSTNGFTTYLASTASTFRSLALEGDGRLVAAGVLEASGGNTIVARFTTSNAIDTSFGDAGGTAATSNFCQGMAVAIGPHSGAIVVSGGNNATGDLPGCFSEWSSSGVPGWTVNGQIGGGAPFFYNGLANMGDPQDRMYAVGSGGDSMSRSAELARIRSANGSFDGTFGPAGTGHVPLADSTNTPPSFYYTLKAVAVDAFGRIVIAGSKTDASGTNAVIGRFWP